MSVGTMVPQCPLKSGCLPPRTLFNVSLFRLSFLPCFDFFIVPSRAPYPPNSEEVFKSKPLKPPDLARWMQSPERELCNKYSLRLLNYLAEGRVFKCRP